MGGRAQLMAAVGLSIVALTSCVERSGPDIDLFIPPNVQGLIVIVEDKRHGEDVNLDVPVFFIPTNRVLRLKTLAPFERWHRINARYMPGVEILSGNYDISPDDNVVRLFSLSGTSKQNFLFLGTHKQAREVYGRTQALARKMIE